VSEDPAFLDGTLAIPPAQRRILRDLDRRGVKFDELFIAHEITRIGSRGNPRPGAREVRELLAPPEAGTGAAPPARQALPAAPALKALSALAGGFITAGKLPGAAAASPLDPVLIGAITVSAGHARPAAAFFEVVRWDSALPAREEDMKHASWAVRAASEPVLLEPSRDRVTGEVVYAVPPGPAKRDREVTGCAPRLPAGPAVTDLVLTGGGEITAADSAEGELRPVSRIPRGRMAASSWDEIAQALRNVEEGKPGWADVELRPGGQLLLAGPGKDAQPVSRLPRGRMAAANTAPAEADVAVLRRLDPGGAEQWSPVLTGLIAGWTFRLTPPFPGQGQFVFFAFRSPSDGNAYRIAVLRPDMDAEFGHIPHMIRAHVGGQKIPVICGPGGRPAAGLAAVRTHAAKWMAYTSARMAGRNPGFSL